MNLVLLGYEARCFGDYIPVSRAQRGNCLALMGLEQRPFGCGCKNSATFICIVNSVYAI